MTHLKTAGQVIVIFW